MYKSFDCYCKELQIIVEYDGIYHWKDIYGNLKEVQAKDKQLEEWCIQEGWKLIRVNETTYKKKPEVVQTIISLIKNYKDIPNINKLYYYPEERTGHTI